MTEYECDKIFDSKTTKNGTINSPLYSESGFLTCRYEFKAEELERVQIKFFEFSLPKQSNRSDCENADILQLFLPQRSRYELEDTFCGSTIPKPIMSDGSLMLLKYMSRRIGKGTRGFKAEYRFLKNFGITTGEQMSTHCVFAYNSSVDKTGWFTSPNFPGFYPKNLKCNYYFFGQPGERVNIRFTYFDVEGIYPCEDITASDYVEFSNFMSTDRKFAKMCGKKDEINVRSDGRFFRISFNANDRFDKTGFRASYEFETKMVTTENTSLKGSPSRGSPICLTSLLWAMMSLVFSHIHSNHLKGNL
ncbi:suppressor of lurcher protein 1 [Eupeodes corollae]|uniref:suppressor of lurcher protein 1 n=1 Tax=Eupeodes corollae TaxID=290404 RepID=UPI0024908429|nr:suppressor of lurcher protein 1 [Eupeodes corollae]